MQYVSTRGEAPVLWIFRRGAGRPGARRRALCAARMAAVLGRRNPRHARPCLSRPRHPRADAVPRRRDRRAGLRTPGARSLCDLPPRGRLPAGADRPEHLRPGTLPRPDAGLQGRGDAAAGPADGPCAGRARPARHDRRRHLRRHRRGGDRRLCRTRPHRHLHPLPARPRLAGAAAADDDVDRRKRPRAGDRRQFRRLPGPGEGHVQRPRLPRPACRCRASIRSTGPASWPRSSIISPRRCRSARRTGRSPSPCRPAISATSSPAMPPRGWACRSSGWSSPPTTTTSWRARLRPANTARKGVVATTSPSMDIQVSSNFERLLFEASGRDAATVRRYMDGLKQSGAFTIEAGDARQDPRRIRRRPRRHGRGRRDHPLDARSQRLPARPAHRDGRACRRRQGCRRRRPMVVLGTAHPAKFPAAVEAACGVSPALPAWLGGLDGQPRKNTRYFHPT